MKNPFIWFTLIMSILWLLSGCNKYNMPSSYDINSIEVVNGELALHCYAKGYDYYCVNVDYTNTYDIYLKLKEYYEGESTDTNKLRINELLGR